MNDVETRLRDTYAAVLDQIEPADRMHELEEPAGRFQSLSRRLRPAVAFAAAAVVTLVAVGVVALLERDGSRDPGVTAVTAEVFAGETGTASLLEVRFPDAFVAAAGGASGRPIVVAEDNDSELVVLGYVSPLEWEELAPPPWDARFGPQSEGLVAFESDGDTFALLLDDVEGEFHYTIRTTTDGSDWTTYVISSPSRDWGNPAAQRSYHIEDVSVSDGRVAVVVGEHPQPDPDELERFLRDERMIPTGGAVSSIVSYGPDGVGVELSDASIRTFSLAELGIDPEWGYSRAEIWRTNPDGSTASIPFEENVPGARRAQPLTAAVSGSRLYVGGSRRGDAFLAVTDIAAATVQPFTEFDLSGFAFPEGAPAERVTSLRVNDGLVVATVESSRTGALVQLLGDDRSDWPAVQTNGSLDELAIGDGRVFATGYPEVRLIRLELPAGPASSVSLAGEWGIRDRHPTGIAPTDEGLIAVPQTGISPSSFGGDGSVWLIRFVDEFVDESPDTGP